MAGGRDVDKEERRGERRSRRKEKGDANEIMNTSTIEPSKKMHRRLPRHRVRATKLELAKIVGEKRRPPQQQQIEKPKTIKPKTRSIAVEGRFHAIIGSRGRSTTSILTSCGRQSGTKRRGTSGKPREDYRSARGDFVPMCDPD